MEDEDALFGEAFLSFGRVTVARRIHPIEVRRNQPPERGNHLQRYDLSVSDVVQTRFELSMLDGSAEVAIFRPDFGAVSLNLGLMLMVKYVDAEVRLSSETSGSASEDFQGPIPMPGVTAGIGFFRNMIAGGFPRGRHRVFGQPAGRPGSVPLLLPYSPAQSPGRLPVCPPEDRRGRLLCRCRYQGTICRTTAFLLTGRGIRKKTLIGSRGKVK